MIGVVLTCIANIYLKFKIVPTNNERSRRPPHRPIRLNSIANDLGRNLMFISSHLTNHCKFHSIWLLLLSLSFQIDSPAVISSNSIIVFHLNLNSHRALYIVVGVWLLMTVVLANAIAGTLLSFLSVTKLGLVINSIDELAHSKTCKLIIQGGSDITNQFLVISYSESNIWFWGFANYYYFKDAKDGTFKLIGDSLRADPENVFTKFDRDKFEKKLLTGHYANIHVIKTMNINSY